MKTIYGILAALILVTTLAGSPVVAQANGKAKNIPASAPPQRREIERIVREYLLQNPEIVREAMLALQQKEEKQKNLAVAENIKRLRAEIYSDADSPAAGKAGGDITVVVFYDYFCGHCRRSLPALEQLVARDGAVRVIYKELPIMGPESLVAAKASLAAARQGKFAAFHQALYEADSVSDDALKAIAERLGLDYAKLRADMADPKIEAALERNANLAASLNIGGTPAYLVGEQLIPGAIDAASLAQIVAGERAKLATTKSLSEAVNSSSQ